MDTDYMTACSREDAPHWIIVKYYVKTAIEPKKAGKVDVILNGLTLKMIEADQMY